MNIKEIDEEIEKQKSLGTNWSSIEKLAMLYTVRNNLVETFDGVVPIYTNSEFGKAISNVPIEKLVPILSEHFEVIKMLYPKEYNAVIEKIEGLK